MLAINAPHKFRVSIHKFELNVEMTEVETRITMLIIVTVTVTEQPLTGCLYCLCIRWIRAYGRKLMM